MHAGQAGMTDSSSPRTIR